WIEWVGRVGPNSLLDLACEEGELLRNHLHLECVGGTPVEALEIAVGQSIQTEDVMSGAHFGSKLPLEVGFGTLSITEQSVFIGIPARRLRRRRCVSAAIGHEHQNLS